MVIRWIAALVGFLIVALIGLSGFGNFETGIDPDNFFDTEGANSFALILAVALVALVACRQEGPAEKAGRNIDQAGKDLRDAVKGKK
jgi:hypothetical protein